MEENLKLFVDSVENKINEEEKEKKKNKKDETNQIKSKDSKPKKEFWYNRYVHDDKSIRQESLYNDIEKFFLEKELVVGKSRKD